MAARQGVQYLGPSRQVEPTERASVKCRTGRNIDAVDQQRRRRVLPHKHLHRLVGADLGHALVEEPAQPFHQGTVRDLQNLYARLSPGRVHLRTRAIGSLSGRSGSSREGTRSTQSAGFLCCARRGNERRSNSSRPPQTPWSCRVSMAQSRQVSRTWHWAHTCFATVACIAALAVVPMGKNSSGTWSRHAANIRQSTDSVPSPTSPYGIGGRPVIKESRAGIGMPHSDG